MAQTMKPDSASPSAKHNVGGVEKVIRECRAQMLQVIGQREALNAEASEIRERLRDSGVQVKAFMFSLKVCEMDAEAQNEYLDSLRVNFDAMGIGDQGEMFLNTVGEEQPQDVAAARKAAQAAGEAAGAAGGANTDNPHQPSDPRHGIWHAGWMDSTRKRAKEMRPKNAPAETPAKPKRSRSKKKADAPVADIINPNGVGLSPLSTASKAGRIAAEAGEPIEANPHAEGSSLHEYWAASWKSYSKQHPARHTAPTNPEPADIVA